jgi:transposase-like protein
MDIKRHKPEEIVSKLRQVDVLVGQGWVRKDAIRQVSITEQTYYRWRKQYGGMGADQLKELKKLQKENEQLRCAVAYLTIDKQILAEAAPGKLLSHTRRRRCIDQMRDMLGVSERRACLVLGQHRSTKRHVPIGRADEERLVKDLIELARLYGGYGYRRVAVPLRDAGWSVGDGRIKRLWKREGLKVPPKKPKRGRHWLNDGSCNAVVFCHGDAASFQHELSPTIKKIGGHAIATRNGRDALPIKQPLFQDPQLVSCSPATTAATVGDDFNLRHEHMLKAIPKPPGSGQDVHSNCGPVHNVGFFPLVCETSQLNFLSPNLR